MTEDGPTIACTLDGVFRYKVKYLSVSYLLPSSKPTHSSRMSSTPLLVHLSTTNGYGKTLADCRLWFHATTALYPAPQETVVSIVNVGLGLQGEPNPPELMK